MKLVFYKWKFPAYAEGVFAWNVGRVLARKGEDITFYCSVAPDSAAGEAKVKKFPLLFNLRVPLELRNDLPDFAYGISGRVIRAFALHRTDLIAPFFWPPSQTIEREIAGEKYRGVGLVCAPTACVKKQRGLESSLGEREILHLTRREMSKECRKAGFRNRSIVVPHGVDTQTFSPRAERHSGFRILFVGNDAVRKGLPYLVSAFSELRKSRGHIEMAVVSSGVLSLEQPGVRHVKTVPFSGMPALYNSCDAFVLPSLMDGTPFSVLEAMACGLPVITTKGIGYDSIIKNHKNGFLVGKGDSNGIKDFLGQLADSRELRAEIGKNARTTALLNTWGARAKTFLSELKRVA